MLPVEIITDIVELVKDSPKTLASLRMSSYELNCIVNRILHQYRTKFHQSIPTLFSDIYQCIIAEGELSTGIVTVVKDKRLITALLSGMTIVELLTSIQAYRIKFMTDRMNANASVKRAIVKCTIKWSKNLLVLHRDSMFISVSFFGTSLNTIKICEDLHANAKSSDIYVPGFFNVVNYMRLQQVLDIDQNTQFREFAGALQAVYVM